MHKKEKEEKMEEKNVQILTDFPEVTLEQWMEVVKKDLKGADFNRKLVWHTNEGFDVMPFYRQEDVSKNQAKNAIPGIFPFLRGTKRDNNWLVRQDIVVTDPTVGNKKILTLLSSGIESLGLTIAITKIPQNFIRELLKDIHLEIAEINFTIPYKTVDSPFENHQIVIEQFAQYCSESGYDTNKIKGSIDFDPIYLFLTKGYAIPTLEIADITKRLLETTQSLPLFKTTTINTRLLANAGSFSDQELGYALSWGNFYLDILTDGGLSAEEVAKKIKFNFAIGGNYFMEIAKFRAAKMLWAKIIEAYCPDNKDEVAKMHIHAETSTYNLTIYDAHVNMLRTQTEAMSAAIGGVDSITVHPFDITYKDSDNFSERIARNQQLLLKEESHFDKVADPSAGSYYIETLTAELAKKAWERFLKIEDSTDFLTAITEAIIQDDIKDTHLKRQANIAKRREVILGTNQYPNISEIAEAKIEQEPKKSGHPNTLDATRGAEEFERLRLTTEQSGKRPKVFLLPIGNLAMRLARAQFSSNFFGCAGYEIIDNLGFKTVEEGANAVIEAKADIVVICSSDDEYSEYAPKLHQLVHDKAEVVVAGNPASMDDLKAVGINNFISVRSNVLETLQQFNDKLLK